MQQSISRSCVCCLLIMLLPFANGIALAQSATRPTVIELFTSQGCNSCPPADALLGELANRPEILALAFHVDYWDYIGWRDQFALPIAAQRQQQYQSALSLNSSFTPQAIVDGSRSVLGSNRSALFSAVNERHAAIPVTLSVSPTELVIALDELQEATHFDVNVISFLPQAATSIGRGENAGHVLKEFNIVRSFRKLDYWDGKARHFYLPLSSLPADASKVAVLLQQPGAGRIVGAASIAVR
jgi:hypothetical protein